MQPDKGPSFIAHLTEAETRRRTLRNISRWARGGMSVDLEATGPAGLARRGLVGAARPHSAQAIVEFMLVSVPLLAIIFGLLEFGLVFFESTTLDISTRDIARTIAVCGVNCDKYDPTTGVLVYRDYNLRMRLQNQDRGYLLNLDNVEYILLQHVGEDTDLPTVVAGVPLQPGRKGPDTAANYQYHWQLYAPSKSTFAASDPRQNTVPATGANRTNPENLRIQDASPSEVKSLGVLPSLSGVNDNYNGWRSSRCTSSADPATTCRKPIPAANPDGSADTSPSASPRPIWTGRFNCIPTDRFYVQIAYRHFWITPFLPTVSTTGRNPSLQGFGERNSLLLFSKIYEKIEPNLYSNGAC